MEFSRSMEEETNERGKRILPNSFDWKNCLMVSLSIIEKRESGAGGGRKGVKGGGKGGSRVTPAASFRDAVSSERAASISDAKWPRAPRLGSPRPAPSGAWTNLLDSRPSNSLRTRLPNELHTRAHARTKDYRIFDACLETGIRIKNWISDWIIE